MSLNISFSYDSSVTTLNTSDPTLYQEYTTAVTTAVNFFENAFTNNITVNINFGWGEVGGAKIDPGASGESSSNLLSPFTYDEVKNALIATDTTSAVQMAAVASLPATDPTGGKTFTVNSAEAKALGLTGASTDSDGSVGLDSSQSWAWVGQSYTSSDSEDAVGTLEHEISEVLGRTDTGGKDNQYSPLDLFRYTAKDGLATDPIGAAAGARDQPFVAGYDANAPSYFSYDGKQVTLLYETPADVVTGSDVGDWAPSVGFDSFGDGPNGAPSPVSATDLQEMNVLGYDTACFAAGTRIATMRGDIPVEALAIGDEVILAPENGAGTRKILWLGHRRIDCTRHPNPSAVWPILVRAGAFAEHQPVRDLWISPGHSVFINGALIQAENLVNGATILQIPRDHIEYWHVELETHSILLSEGLPTESYLDTGNRTAFINGGAYLEIHPDFKPKHFTETCAPLIFEGEALMSARTSLLARAGKMGYVTTGEDDMHIIADGKRIDAVTINPSRKAMMLPAGCETIILKSRSFIPAQHNPESRDKRSLGICVARLQLNGAEIPLGHPGFNLSGWHADETQSGRTPLRWTTGDTPLPPHTRLVLLDYAGRGQYWSTPTRARLSLCA